MDKHVILEPELRSVLSDCIFKYGKTEYVDRTLANTQLRFSELSDFNDIHESDYRITHFFHSIDDQKKLFAGGKTPLDRVNRIIREYLKELRVTCFSYSGYNNLMWSHYADNHYGVCYCFDRASTKKTIFSDEKIWWGNVQYSTHVPEVKVFQDQTTVGTLEASLDNVVLTKSTDWSYEQELRYILRGESQNIAFKPESLKAIIVGRRVVDSEIDCIEDAVRSYNVRNDTNVRVLYAHHVPSTYMVGVISSRGSRGGGFNARIPVINDINSEVVTVGEEVLD